MTELKTFEFMPGMTLRVTGDAENPWFVAKDVCDALEMSGSAARWLAGLEADEKHTLKISRGIRGNPNTTVVSESGLYALVMRSRKPEAKAFRKWVTSVVLPAIREDDGELRQAEDEIVHAAWHILHRRLQERTGRGRGMGKGADVDSDPTP